MLSNYGLVGLFLIVAILFSLVMVVFPIILRYLKIVPSNPGAVKGSIFECGLETFGKTWVQFNFRYYFFALLFVALDVLVVFLYPWGAQLRQLGAFSFWVVIIMLAIISIGYVYAWKKRALEWK
jgi:NADH-quinone oxidoreductase subunit A